VLTEYIPALRNATTQTEKLDIVNNLATRGYSQMAEELNTTAGRWKELKGRVGDFMEALGKAITGGLDFKEILATLSESIKAFGTSPRFEAFAARLRTTLMDAKEFIKIMAGGGERRVTALKTLGDVIRLSFISGAQSAVNIIHKGLLSAWEALKDKMFDPKNLLKLTIPGAVYFGAQKAGAASVKGGDVASDLVDVAKTNKELADAIGRLASVTANPYANLPPMPKIPTVTRPGAAGATAGAGGVSTSTSLIGAGDLFTMMQTGQARQTELHELQKQTTTLEEIRDAIENSGVE